MDGRIVIVVVGIILLIGWLYVSKPAYYQEVAEVGVRIQDHIEEIAVMEQVINKQLRRWE